MLFWPMLACPIIEADKIVMTCCLKCHRALVVSDSFDGVLCELCRDTLRLTRPEEALIGRCGVPYFVTVLKSRR